MIGNIVDNVSTQLNKIYNIGPVVFRHYNTGKLHIILFRGMTDNIDQIGKTNEF